jgi:hypothetical protein
MKTVPILVIFLSLSFLSPAALSQIEVYDNEDGSHTQQAAPKTGRDAAADYFRQRKKSNRASSSEDQSQSSRGRYRPAARSVASSGDRFLSLSLGVFFDNESYAWGEENQDGIAEFRAGLTYRIG